MSKIAPILTDMFEDREYAEPAKAFKKVGHEVVHVGLKARATVKGAKEGTPVKIDKAVKDVSAAASAPMRVTAFKAVLDI